MEAASGEQLTQVQQALAERKTVYDGQLQEMNNRVATGQTQVRALADQEQAIRQQVTQIANARPCGRPPMPPSEMIFLFFIGVMFAVVFRLTKNILILWPLFQPMGQLVTLIKDGLTLPLAAALGFGEVLILMLVLVWLANRFQRKHREPAPVLQVTHDAGV